jgi:hypothetical protein
MNNKKNDKLLIKKIWQIIANRIKKISINKSLNMINN